MDDVFLDGLSIVVMNLDLKVKMYVDFICFLF